MKIFLITFAVILGLLMLALIAAAIAGFIDHLLHPNGHKVSPRQVREQLQEILDGRNPYALDDFISCGSFKNPRLETIRQRVAQLDEEFPREANKEYCGPKGIEVIREYVRELEHENEV
jgi:hypothetical protein